MSMQLRKDHVTYRPWNAKGHTATVVVMDSLNKMAHLEPSRDVVSAS